MDRREFVQGLMVQGLVGAVATTGLRAEAETSAGQSELQARLAADPLRPQYHLLPLANWMNDPNGPIYWQQKYHMFYQYNPEGAYWGDMHWGHAVSGDMVHWKQLPVALAPTPGGPDADGCFTGTAVVKDGRVVMLYTGVRAAPEDQATIRNGAESLLETQCMAVASASDLGTWTKVVKPVLAAPPEGMAVNGFRDPAPWREGDWWYMAIGSGIAGKGGAVLLYRSRDLAGWEFLHILAGREGSIAVATDHADPKEVWECPDFFELGSGDAARHVLIYSTAGKAYWLSGRLDRATMRFVPEQAGTLDYGSFYAPKTQLDQAGNRILWGWIPETRPLAEYKAAGWAGLMSLPRVMRLDGEGRVRVSVAEEAMALRGREQKLTRTGGDRTGDEASRLQQIAAMRIEGYCGEILCVAGGGLSAFELALESGVAGQAAWLRVAYDLARREVIAINGAEYGIRIGPAEALEIHVCVDGSATEVFVNRQVACTLRCYPEGARAKPLHLTWTGKTSAIEGLSVWQLKPISGDRLTRLTRVT